MVFSLEEFTSFVHSKAFDVISSGNFKKHLVLSRDEGDRWAVTMHQNQLKVLASFRVLQTQLAGMTCAKLSPFVRICKDVMVCAQPPIKVFSGSSRCCITGLSTDYSIDLTRNCKNSTKVLVHPRFWHFFIFLWVSSKIEYIIRACTKQWVEKCQFGSSVGITERCEAYMEESEDFIDKMFQIYVKALDYVMLSLQKYEEFYESKPVLRPPWISPIEHVSLMALPDAHDKELAPILVSLPEGHDKELAPTCADETLVA